MIVALPAAAWCSLSGVGWRTPLPIRILPFAHAIKAEGGLMDNPPYYPLFSFAWSIRYGVIEMVMFSLLCEGIVGCHLSLMMMKF